MNMKFLIAVILMLSCFAMSRISYADTLCPQGIGSEDGDVPFLTTGSPGKKFVLIFCGDDSHSTGKYTYHASEYEVIRTDNSGVIYTFGALDETDITIAKDSITIIRTERMPIGKDWIWVDAPTLKYRINFTSDGKLVTDCKNVFVAPAISKREIERVLKEYAQLENVSLTEDTMDGTFVKLMVAALSGSEQARLDFFDIGKRPEVDGAVAEFYDIVSRIFIAASTKSDGGCSKAVNILK